MNYNALHTAGIKSTKLVYVGSNQYIGSGYEFVKDRIYDVVKEKDPFEDEVTYYLISDSVTQRPFQAINKEVIATYFRSLSEIRNNKIDDILK